MFQFNFYIEEVVNVHNFFQGESTNKKRKVVQRVELIAMIEFKGHKIPKGMK